MSSGELRWRAAMCAVAIVSLVSTSAQAQCRDCAPADTINHFAFFPAFGLRIGEPQQLSVAGGINVGRRWQSGGHDHTRDVALFVEPGLGAGRASLAYVDYHHGNFGSGAALALTAIRTWRNPWGVQPNVSYVGGELFVWPIVFVGPRIGLFHSVSTGAAANRWLLSFDLGLGL